MIELVPYFMAVTMLLVVFYMSIRVKLPILGAVISLMPIINLTVDNFVDGNLTIFRSNWVLIYSGLLLIALIYNVRKGKI